MNIIESFDHHDDRQVVINELEHQKTLVLELRDIVQPILPKTHDGLTKSVLQLFEDMLSSSSKAISLLELSSGNNHKHGNIVGGNNDEHGKHDMENHSNLREEPKATGNKRRKNAQHTGSLVTQAPYHDGCQWRKYGQKWISKARHTRSYYRCANSKGQGCPATKTVQQMETHGSKLTRLFNVDYYGQHTCKRDVHPYVVETIHRSVSPVNNNQCNIPMPVNEVHQVQDESFENLFMVPDMPEYLADIEMARLVEATMNLPLDPEPWEFSDPLRCQQQSPLYIW